jgi:predicted amidohydrolase
MRIALAPLRFRRDPSEALRCVESALAGAARHGARLVCSPENYLPGLRGVEFDVAPPEDAFLASAERTICEAVARLGVGAIIGVERPSPRGPIASAMVVSPDGRLLGYQDKVQIDPAEDEIYVAGSGRRVFQIDDLHFGVCICHEGWRYPETVRWAARRGARIVFHLQYSPSAPTSREHGEWASSSGTMHEKAAICRAAENTIYFATVNYAIANSIAGTAVVDPEGHVCAIHPDGTEGLLFADIDLSRATGLLARRLAAAEYP